MKNRKLLSVLLSTIALTLTFSLTSCNDDPGETEVIDYADQCKFNPNSGRIWQETTIRQYIDGDTVHFDVNWAPDGVYKARFLGIDTPESTGQVQPWGKEASHFTQEKLSTAKHVIIESDTSTWNVDSTGGRYTTWVWYTTDENASDYSKYRLVNLEIIQEGLSMLKAAGDSTYGAYFTPAFQQAKDQGLRVAANKKDPNFYEDGPIETSISELILNPTKYEDKTVRVDGLITLVDDTTFYIEKFDPLYDQTFGMDVFMGYNFAGANLCEVGTEMSIAGYFGYSDIVSKYQISSLTYMEFIPDLEENIRVISQNNTVTPKTVTPESLKANKQITQYVKDETTGEETSVTSTKSVEQLSLFTYVKMENLTVTSTYTTTSGSSNGAITLTCKDANDNKYTVRTSVLYSDASSYTVAKASQYANKNISVVGVVDSYTSDGSSSTQYQIHVFFYEDIKIN